MSYNELTVLRIVKARLNRLASDTSLDEYLFMRIEAANEELKRNGIHIDTNSIGDSVFLADIVVWQHNNRDKAESMPEWLRLARRERWLKERGENDT